MIFHACKVSVQEKLEKLEEVDQDEFHDLVEENETDRFCPESVWGTLLFLIGTSTFENNFSGDDFRIFDDEGFPYFTNEALDGGALDSGPDGCQLLDDYLVSAAVGIFSNFSVEDLKKRFESEGYRNAVKQGKIYRPCEDFNELKTAYLGMREFFEKADSRGDLVVYYWI